MNLLKSNECKLKLFCNYSVRDVINSKHRIENCGRIIYSRIIINRKHHSAINYSAIFFYRTILAELVLAEQTE